MFSESQLHKSKVQRQKLILWREYLLYLFLFPFQVNRSYSNSVEYLE